MKMRTAFLGLLLLIWVVNFGVSDASAQARKKFVSKPGTSKYTQTHIIDVGDVPNHQLRLFELHTVYTGEAPDFDGVKKKSASLVRFPTTSTAAARQLATRSTSSKMATRSLSA